MHELSIAEALLDQVRRHAPPGSRILSVSVEAGAGQSIEEDCLQLAWQALTRDTELGHAVLHVTTLPWTLKCNTCNRTWQSPDPLNPCPCSSSNTQASASHELHLLSIEVDNDPTPSPPELHFAAKRKHSRRPRSRTSTMKPRQRSAK